MNGESLDITKDNIDKLKQLFPEILTDGDKIDFEKLKTVLGEEIEGEKERYSFNWYGKKNAILGAQTPSKGTLRPDKEKSKYFDMTENLYIEGDNLEVLKLLQKSYSNKIKMIYIDPPYNTGKDFVYKDNFRNGVENYLEQTGQTDDEGNRLSTNSENNGRYHTDWLNMMYPRLKLARNLLANDGVIFISIDDTEENRLKNICDEIFGEQNLIAKITHKNNSNKNQSKYIGVSTEYMFVYAKSLYTLPNELWKLRKRYVDEALKIFGELKNKGLSDEELTMEINELFKRPKFAHLSRWNKVDQKGIFMDADLSREGGNKNYTIINPFTNKKCPIPNRGWAKSYEELIELQNKDLIWYGNPITPPRMKDYLSEDRKTVPDNFWYFDNSIDVRWQKKEFGKYIFENPKPLNMIKQAIMLNTEKNDIVLDFFSGSATTAHATMQLNAEDGGNRRFIMVQLPEQLDEKSEAYKDGYRTICDIGEERIRRAGELVKQELIEKNTKVGMLADDIVDPERLDIGFKVLKLDKSNIREWNSDFEGLEDNLFAYEDVFVEDRSELDVVYEIMLKNGLELTYNVNQFEHEGKNVYDIAYGNLFVCLADNIDVSVVQIIVEKRNEYGTDTSSVVLKDAGFKSDADKLNVIELLKDSGYPEENILTI